MKKEPDRWRSQVRSEDGKLVVKKSNCTVVEIKQFIWLLKKKKMKLLPKMVMSLMTYILLID